MTPKRTALGTLGGDLMGEFDGAANPPVSDYRSTNAFIGALIGPRRIGEARAGWRDSSARSYKPFARRAALAWGTCIDISVPANRLPDDNRGPK
jgi:hypothetical protein